MLLYFWGGSVRGLLLLHYCTLHPGMALRPFLHQYQYEYRLPKISEFYLTFYTIIIVCISSSGMPLRGCLGFQRRCQWFAHLRPSLLMSTCELWLTVRSTHMDLSIIMIISINVVPRERCKRKRGKKLTSVSFSFTLLELIDLFLFYSVQSIFRIFYWELKIHGFGKNFGK